MRLIQTFINKPVLAITLSLALFILGLIALSHLPLRLLPKVEIPLITITTNYLGATPETIQTSVSNIIENTLSGLEGLDYMTASSQYGQSEIQLYFRGDFDLDRGLLNVINKISSVRQQLPKEIEEPQIKKNSADDNPALILAFSSNSLPTEQVKDYLQRNVQPLLEQITGVAQINVMGSDYAMQIRISPESLHQYDLTPHEALSAINQQNNQFAIGEMKNLVLNFNLDASLLPSTAEKFKQMKIKSDSSVLLKDLGDVQLTAESEKINAIVNGEKATMIFVTLLPSANPLKVVKKIKQNLTLISNKIPSQIQTKIVLDVTRYMDLAIKELLKSMLEAFLIVSAVIFWVMRSKRNVIIPLVTIPLSLISVCLFLWLFDYSLNNLTLLAMVVAIGLVVDDAIVVMENIVRHTESGFPLRIAVINGVQEIAMPVVAMSIVLAAVFLPIAFSHGLTQRLFSEFALTVSLSVLISGVISLTLTPVMCVKFLKKPASDNKSAKSFFSLLSSRVRCGVLSSLRAKRGNPVLNTRRRQIRAQALDCNASLAMTILQKILSAKSALVILWMIAVLGSVILYQIIPKELAPREDQGFLQIIGSAPSSTSSAFLQNTTKKLNQIYQSNENIARYVYITGIPLDHQFLSFLTLKPWEDRHQTTTEIKSILQKQLNQTFPLQTTVIEPSGLPGANGLPVQFVIKSSGSYEELNSVVEKIKMAALKSGMFAFLEQDLNFDKPQIKLEINTSLASEMHVGSDQVAEYLSFFYSKKPAAQFNLNNRRYNVIFSTDNEFSNPAFLQIKNWDGVWIPLENIVKTKLTVMPVSLNQFQKLNSVTLSGVMMPGHAISKGLNFLENTAVKFSKKNMSFDFAGESRQLKFQEHDNLILFLLSGLVVFSVLAIQFDSFKMPLIVLFGSVPFALFSALLTLWFMDLTLNIYTQIALLTLIGLISKHGILITQFARQIQNEQNCSARAAVINATKLRLRPILMTSASMVLGVLPFLLCHGVGSHSRFNMGVVLASGMTFGTLFALAFVPFVYCFLTNHSSQNQKIRSLENVVYE